MYDWIPAVYCLPPSNIPFLTFKHFDTWNAINIIFFTACMFLNTPDESFPTWEKSPKGSTNKQN